MNPMRHWTLLGLLALAPALACAETNAPPALVEMHVKTLGVTPDGQTPVVMLTDGEERLMLPIWVGLAEAQSIMMELRGIRPPRPMTHELIHRLILEMGGKVDRLTITEMRDNTYFGMLTLTVDGNVKEIDCRPSDGIAIALHAKVPIMATAAVMKQALALPKDVPSDETKALEFPALGVTVQTVTKDLAVAFGINQARGILVSSSSGKELMTGDIIIGVGDKDVNSTTEFKLAFDQADRTKPIQIRLLRENKPISFDISLPKE